MSMLSISSSNFAHQDYSSFDKSNIFYPPKKMLWSRWDNIHRWHQSMERTINLECLLLACTQFDSTQMRLKTSDRMKKHNNNNNNKFALIWNRSLIADAQRIRIRKKTVVVTTIFVPWIFVLCLLSWLRFFFFCCEEIKYEQKTT